MGIRRLAIRSQRRVTCVSAMELVAVEDLHRRVRDIPDRSSASGKHHSWIHKSGGNHRPLSLFCQLHTSSTGPIQVVCGRDIIQRIDNKREAERLVGLVHV